MQVALITNSINLSAKHYPLLKRFNYIAVSVYSTKKEQYEAIVGAKHFDRQFELPSKVWGAEIRNSSLIIGARCVINHINYKEIFNIYQATMDCGFDYCLFIPAVDYEKRQIALTDSQKAFVLNQIEANLDKINPITTNLLNIKANNIGHYKKEYIRGCFISKCKI